ncbi:TonB-dependent receptor [Fulvivirgaceae bacterium BMA12]|uniref:TonB-dependent receptor n=1 Tax=Agaribacillus aureus TaxID=3051825 RepID=A0ABT8LJR8_9BACT|nr:TonB-dependent receptor [Fulvivirgaceae bacterium BMA12]
MKSKIIPIIWMVLKHTFYVILMLNLSLSTLLANAGMAQIKSLEEIPISISLNNITVRKALNAIEQKTGFIFTYSKEKLNERKKINANVENGTLEALLLSIASQADLKFYRVNNTISVTQTAKKNAKDNLLVEVLEKTISGKVTDEYNEPLPGVNIVVKGTGLGTISDSNGDYTLNVADDATTIIFSFVGYLSEEVEINGRSVIDVSLLPDISTLSEVVVIGYGSVQKKDLTGSVSSIDAEDVNNLPASRIDQIIQGRAPGVLVTANNGAPGARSSIRIRGGNSINADNEPLYVIDGFIVGTGFNLNNINVNDIESLEILKDATAISIYGTRGANGVILVTTKSGTKVPTGKPEISLNAYTGVQELARKIDYLDGPARAAYGSELAAFSGEADPFTDPSEIGNVDWQDQITETGTINNVDLSFAGRTEKLNYYVSANVFDQRGVIRESGIRRYNLRTNMDLNISEKLRFGLRLNTSFTKTDHSLVTLWGMREVLTAFPIYNEDGTFNALNPVTGGVLRNPEADLQLKTNFTNQTNILSTAYFEFEPIEGLVIKSSIGPRLNWSKRNIFDSGNLPTRAAAQQGGRARITNGYFYDILQENTVSYSTEFSENHKIDAVAGFTWQLERNETFAAETDGLTLDALGFDAIGLGDPLTFDIESGFSGATQIVSWLGRANYTFKDKYLFTVAARVDGASVYAGSNNAYSFFPSAAFAWRLIDEPFIKDLGVFDNLKLRASYGSAGKESIAPYRTLAVLNSAGLIFNDIQTVAIFRGRPENPELTWETTNQFDIGLEMGFFEGRLNLEMDYYYKKTTDLLLERQIARATGFSTKLENVGSVQNQGLELMISSLNIDKGNFKWETTLTVAGNRSKVLDLGGVDEIVRYSLEQGGPGSKLIVGEPIGVYTGVKYLGTYKSQDEIDADGNLGIRQVVGGPRFNDTNGDGVINNDDHEILGNPEPDFYGGINNVVSYKDFTLELYFQGTYGNEIYNEYAQRGFFGRSTANMYADLINRWTPENPNSDIPRAGSMVSISDIRSNSELIEDGSHLRLKNIRLSYNVPLKNRSTIKSLTVYGLGSNVFLLSDFRGYDPEVNRLGTNSTVRGIARAEYPNARTFTVGLRANF